jgi:hypothetical protein
MIGPIAWHVHQERLGDRQSEVDRKLRGNDFAGEARFMFFATCRELGDHLDHCSISPFLRLSLAAGGQRVMFDGHDACKLPAGMCGSPPDQRRRPAACDDHRHQRIAKRLALGSMHGDHNGEYTTHVSVTVTSEAGYQ